MTTDVLAWLDSNHRDVRRGSARLRRRYKYSVDELWSACTDRARLARWFGAVDGDPNGPNALTIDAGLPHKITSRVLACEAPHGGHARLLITWSYDGDPVDPPDEVEARISVDPERTSGSVLELEHRTVVEYPSAIGVGSGWESWLWGIDLVLAGNAAAANIRGAPDDVNAQIDARWSRLVEPTAVRTGNELRFTRRFPRRRDDVWRALVESFARWYPARLDGALAAGSDVRFVYEDGTSLPGKVVACTRPELLVFTENDDEVRVELRAEGKDGGATLLVFTHRFAGAAAQDPGVPSMATGWDLCLDELWRVLDGRPPLGDAELAARRQELRHAYRNL